MRILKDGNVVHRWQIFFRLSAGKRGNMYYDIKESGKRIKELRRKEGMTQEVLAEKVGLSTEMVSRMERGVAGASIDTLGTLAEVFNETVDYIAFGKVGIVGLEIPYDKYEMVSRVVKAMLFE